MNSTRLGLYETVDQLNWTRFSPTSPHSTVLCVLWGAASGVAGSAVGCPLYMVKTQLQAQSNGQFAVGFQHSHTGMVNALISTYQSQGVRGLWRGFEGIVPRTAVGSAIQITTFTMSKDVLSQYNVRIIAFILCVFPYIGIIIRIILILILMIKDISTIQVFDVVGIEHDKWIIFKYRNDTI